jgi:type IV pilus assembly protein PilB
MSERLLEILLRDKVIDEKQAEEIKVQVTRTRKTEEQLLMELEYATDAQIAKAKSEAFNIPFVDLMQVRIPPQTLAIVPATSLSAHQAVPFEETPSSVKFAMVDPFDIPAIQALQREVPKGKKVEVYIAPRAQVASVIDRRFQEGISTEVHEALESVEEPVTEIKEVVDDITAAEEQLMNAPVARIVNSILTYGVKSLSSDIHIEPLEKEVRVRYRIHGVMQEKLRLPKNVHSSMVARVKILSELKLDEKRIPQDGRFQISVQDRRIDIRVSTMPTVYGEKVVMRLLERTSGVPTLETTGLRGTAYKTYLEATQITTGIILISGPTGSGKTRTLAGTISKLKVNDMNVVTLEDPVEIRIPGVNQIQVNPDAGLTFASGLRSILRQDPDVIMVGEIRDGETASLAVQAALTGHLVLSTIHTNSAAAALPRLADMGIEPYLLSSVLNLVVAQRLPRRICPHCKKAYVAPQELVDEVANVLGTIDRFNVVEYLQRKCKAEEIQGAEEVSIQCPVDKGNGQFDVYLYKGEGCDQCGQTGYIGRIGIFEVLKVTDKTGRLIMENRNANEIEQQAVKDGMITMMQDGYLKALEGITTIEEVMRVSRD